MLKYLFAVSILILIIYFRWVFKALLYAFNNNLTINGGWLSYLWIWKEIFFDKDYNIQHNLDGKVIFDIGCNIGVFSLWLNKNYNNITVHCFEPIPDLFNAASNNINHNKKNNNTFFINNFGLSSEKNTLEINYFPYVSGLSTLYNDINEKENAVESAYSKVHRIIWHILTRNKKKLDIQVKTVNEYINKNNITNIDLVKLDVEGAELDIMKGFGENINIVKEYIIEIENYRKNYLDNIKSLLNDFHISVEDADKSWCFVKAIRKY